jgi:DNA-binding transcriptional MerR regulator
MTISHLARKHGLSRSTLLYYDRIGLLRPVGRLGNSYRHYTAADDKRLGQICLYRRTGLPLAEIGRLLERPRRDLAGALERQLHDLLAQIEAMRNRQRLIVELLKDRRLLEQVRPMTKEKWVRLLRTSGFTDKDLRRWHRDFERSDPPYHQRFLEFLGIPPAEIRAIREHSREAAPAATVHPPPRPDSLR